MFISPLDQFEIKPIIMYKDTYIITNYMLYLSLIMVLILGFNYILSISTIVPNRYNLIILSIYDTISNMVKKQIGLQGGMYFPMIFTLFNIIIIANLVSLVPYSFAYTAQLVGIILLSMTLWIGIALIGLSKHGLSFFSLFVPTGTPLPLVPVLVIIEMLSYCSRAISLGLRLSSNILSGHLLMLILGSLIFNLINNSFLCLVGGLIPMLGVVAITILELAISLIQGYVFCIILCGYIKDAIYLH